MSQGEYPFSRGGSLGLARADTHATREEDWKTMVRCPNYRGRRL